MQKVMLMNTILLFFYSHISSAAEILEPGSIRRSCSKWGAMTPPRSRVDTTARLKRLREEMAKENSVQDKPLDAYLITSDDEHQSEAVSEHNKRRQYISGFSGSSGDAIVTFKKAALWTDGRYHLQADDQLDCNWLLMKTGRGDVPTQAEWLRANLEKGARVGADPKLIANALWTSLKWELENNSISLVTVENNLVDLIWVEGRPPKSDKYAYVWNITFSGKPWTEKVDELRLELQDIGADAMVVTALDEVAWLLNIRGRDIPYNPFVESYLVVSHTEIHMYVYPNKTRDVENHLRTEFGATPHSVQIHDYNRIWTHLPTLSQSWKCILLPSAWVYAAGVSEAIYSTVPEDKRLSRPSPIIFLKAQKNPTEIRGMERASIRDSATLIEFLAFLEKDIKKGEYWDEYKVARVVNEYRFETELGRGNSFESIAAYGPNGAKPHYETTNITSIYINNTSTLVLDSGGQYLDGTTDVTRTLHFGTPTDDQKLAYTRVLMGCIDLSMLVFPANLPISAADVLARAPLWQLGLDYMHGTGHGVGTFLSVHESPISVSYSGPQKQQKFKVGYFFSNEPGYYREGDYGIRLENILEVIEKYPNRKHHSGESYLGFKDITLVPYEHKLIDYNLLSPTQRRWLNSYNTRIRAYVGNELKRKKKVEALMWLNAKTNYIPEYGPYSTGHKNIFNVYIILLNVVYFIYKRYFIIY